MWFKYHSKRHQYKLDTTDYETAVVKAEAEIAKIKAEAGAAPLVKDGKATFNEVLEHFLLALQKQVQSKEMKPAIAKPTSYSPASTASPSSCRPRSDFPYPHHRFARGAGIKAPVPASSVTGASNSA